MTFIFQKKIGIILATFLLSIVLFVSMPSANANTFPGQNGKIMFSSTNSLYTVNPDGTGLEQFPLIAQSPSGSTWNPDGNMFAFIYNCGTYFAPIFCNVFANLDGSDIDPYPNPACPSWVASITFSPDGRFACTSYIVGYGGRYTVSNLDGTNANFIDSDINNVSWSPDGTKIAFHSGRDNQGNSNVDIYTMNPDGTGITRLTNNSDCPPPHPVLGPYSCSGALSVFPSFSPDGTKIVFSSNWGLEPYYYNIYTINSDGTGLTQITFDNNAQNQSPRFSPDGTKIVFSSFNVLTQISDIFVVGVDGTGLTPVLGNTDINFGVSSPSWQSIVNAKTPSEQTQDLINQINAINLDKNSKSSLLAPLKQIQKILDDGKPGNDLSACGKLNDFIITLNSKHNSGKISNSDYNALLNAANSIKTSLGC